MTRNMIQVFLYELRRGLRRRGFLFTTFGIPMLALVALLILPRLLAISAQEAAESVAENPIDFGGVGRAGYVDLSGVFADVERVPDGLSAYADEAAARAALDADEIDSYYMIAADYLETGDVTLVIPSLQLDALDGDNFDALASAALTAGLDADTAARLTRPPTFTEVNLALIGAEDETGAPAEDTAFLLVYVFAIALLFSLFFTNGYLLQTVIEEKETRLIEILLSSVRPSELLVGKVLAMGLLGLLQMATWVIGVFVAIQIAASGAQITPFVAAIAAIQLPTGIIPLLAMYFVLSYLLFAALYGIVGAMSNSMREGPQYAVIFTLPAVFPLYFVSLFASAPDGALPTILSIFPITAPLAMVQRLVISEVPGWQIALSLALLAAAGVGALWMAGRLFRMQTLWAGQTIKLRELPRLLRG
ncbi:MAG: ABC transporter permease [Chloroflexota bacterium]|nr:ABC transporter permease [Chloroflexota bacterium]